MATNTEAAQANVNVTAESAEPVAGDVVESAGEDHKRARTDPSPPKEAVPASDHNVTSAATITTVQETEEVKAESVPVVAVGTSTGAAGELKDSKAAQDAPRPATTGVAPPSKTEAVKIESVSTVVAGVVGNLKNVEVGLSKEAVPTSGKSAPAPSLVSTLEGGLRIAEKEAVKGAEETVATVEQHPELIAEGALAAVVGAASLVQPELLPGAIAVVGKMASDSAKKTVTKIATDEGKKVATAIAKDVSTDAAKEKAAEAAGAGTVEGTKGSTDGSKDQKPSAVGATVPKGALPDASKDTPKAPDVPKELSSGHANTENSAADKSTNPEALKEVATGEPPKSGVATENVPTAHQEVIEPSKEVKGEPILGSKSTPQLKEEKEASSPGSERPSASQQALKSTVVAAVSSVTATTKTTTKNEPDVSPEKKQVTISQDSLDLLHKKLDAMHEAIKHLTETLALHLPPTVPVMDTPKPLTGEAVPSGQTSESELISAPAEAPSANTEAPVESVTQTAEQSPTKRPTLEKRSSVLGSMGKIFWPFGSTSTSKTVVEQTGKVATKSDTPKVPTVTVSEVTSGPEIEI